MPELPEGNEQVIWSTLMNEAFDLKGKEDEVTEVDDRAVELRTLYPKAVIEDNSAIDTTAIIIDLGQARKNKEQG